MVEYVTALAAGVGLAAACGFRVFLPVLVAAVASRAGVLHLSPGFAWIGSGPGVVLLGVASVVEVLGYFLPWVGHGLDVMATPAAVVAGAVVAAAAFGEMDPAVKWTAAVVAGAGAAGVVQAGTVSLRAVLAGVTGGASNRLFAGLEVVGAVVVSVLAVVVPVVAVVLAVAVVVGVWRGVRAVRRRGRVANEAGGG